jgi:hypothetical protein
MKGGSSSPDLQLNSEGVVINEGSGDVDFRVESNGNTHMLFVDGANNGVAIGHNNPQDMLHLSTTNAASHIRVQRHESDEALGDGDEIGAVEFWANDSTSFSGASTLRAAIRAEVQNTSLGTRLEFYTGNSSAAVSERMRIIADGNVGINESSPSQKLHVGGNAIITGLTRLGNGTESSPAYQFVDDTNTGMYRSSSDVLGFSTGGTNRLTLGNSAVVFNEGSADVDFRVESNSATYALFVDGGNNHVNIMTSSDLGRVFNVSGDAVIQKASSGATATSGSVLVVEDDDNAELSILGGSSSVLALNFGHSGDNDDGKIDYNTTSGSEEMRFFVNASERLAISKDGDITQPGGDYIYSGGGNFNIKHTGGGQSITFDTTPSGGSTAEGVRITADGVLQSIKGAVFNENSADVDFRVESNGNANMLFVDGGNDQVSIGGAVSETTDTLQVTNAGTGAPTNTRFVNTGNDARGVRVDFFKNRASPTNNDPILEMNFLGKDSAGNAENYANINAYIDDVTSGAEDGILRFSTIVGGVNRNRMDLIPNEVVFNQDGQDINFRVEGSGGGGYVNLIKVDAGNDRVGFGCDPGYFAHWLDDRAGEFQFKFEHQGNNSNRYGGIIQSGSDDNSGTNYHLEFLDGDGTNIGSIRSSGGTVTYATFTASHEGIIPNADNDPSSSANAYPYGTLLETISLSYTQKNGSDSERGILYNVRKTTSANSRAVLGVYGSSLNGAPGNYEAVYKDGDTIPSGKAIGDPYRPPQTNMHNILVLGDGHILCNNSGGNIAMGDGIASSSTAGIGCKATANPSMIIGIAQEAITFSGSETKLVAVQFGLQQFTPWS